MVRIHSFRWGIYVFAGLLCLSIPLLTLISLRHRLDLYLVDDQAEIQFKTDRPVLASRLLQELLPTPTASATLAEAVIDDATPTEEQEYSSAVTSAPEASTSPEAPPETMTENPIQIVSDHTPVVSGYNYTLSQSECSAQFPDLYKELDRAVSLRKEIGNVTPSDIDISWKPYGAVRAMIFNQKVNLSSQCAISLF